MSNWKPYDEYGSRIDEDGRIQCRATITGTYKGEKFEYTDPEGEEGSQFISVIPDEYGNFDVSEWWWSEGNMSCDCNRSKFLPGDVQLDCGETIRLESVVPVNPQLHQWTLHLNEA